MPYRATARSINSLLTNRKNTPSILLLLCGITQANAAYLVGDADFSLQDAATMVSGGSFAVSFDFCGDSQYKDTNNAGFKYNLTLGAGDNVPTPNDYEINVTCTADIFTAFFSIMSDVASHERMLTPGPAGPFIVQYLAATDDTNAQITLSYVYNDSLQEIVGITLSDRHTLPSTIGFAEMQMTNGKGMSIDADITTWTGVVTAEDIKNPQPAPSPAVPEPTTATLSLLALAGLAVRRRRRG